MKLSEMRRLLAEDGIQLTRSLGQNFLHDANQLRRIISAAELTRDDKVLEIGPGLGPLTELLIAHAGEVLAIEKDARLVCLLRKRFAEEKKLTLLHADALEYLRANRTDWGEWKLVANLPYSVGSPILVELAQAPAGPILMTVTLQFEVVRRMIATVGAEDYGILTLLLQLKYESDGFFKIPPGCFFPEPDVESACVTLRRRARPLLDPGLDDLFSQVVKKSFSQRRKMMFKLLREQWPAERLAAAFRAAQIPEQSRAEQASLEQFVTLTQSLARQ